MSVFEAVILTMRAKKKPQLAKRSQKSEIASKILKKFRDEKES